AQELRHPSLDRVRTRSLADLLANACDPLSPSVAHCGASSAPEGQRRGLDRGRAAPRLAAQKRPEPIRKVPPGSSTMSFMASSVASERTSPQSWCRRRRYPVREEAPSSCKDEAL